MALENPLNGFAPPVVENTNHEFLFTPSGFPAIISRAAAESGITWSLSLCLGSRLYRALFAILVAQGFYNAFAGVTMPNEASVALHRGLGFEPVGVYRNVGYKLGAWHDVSWWQRPLRSPAAAAAEPLPFAVLRDRFEELVTA